MLAFQVSQRRREIGIRMALGSSARAIFGLVIKEGVVLLGVGFAAGLAGAFAIRRAMESQLYGVSGTDPRVLGGVAALLASSRWRPVACRRAEPRTRICCARSARADRAGG